MPFRHIRAAVDNIEGEAIDTLKLAQALLKDIQDGFTLKVTVMGKVIPVDIQIIPSEEAAALREDGEVLSFKASFEEVLAKLMEKAKAA